MKPNLVAIRHEGGWVTRYLHLKKNSIPVSVGDRVACGDRLGFVGSSGRSTFPHLHFAVLDAVGRVTDPYAGSVNDMKSLWWEQMSSDGLPGTRCVSASAQE